LYIQTAFGIGEHPLILTSNSKHTQTVEFKLEANSFPSWNWNLEANSIPSLILCIQTQHYGVWMIDYVCIHLQSHVEIYHDCDKRPQNRGQSKREDEKRCIGVGAKRRKSLAIRAESN
jgi:hypothetical protein